MAPGWPDEVRGDAPEGSEHSGEIPAREETIADLFKAHNRALHAFLMTRLRDENEAREVAQEAYVRMLQLDKPGAVRFLRSYLFKTAANIAIDRAKQRKNQARLLEAEAVEEPVDQLSPDRHLLSAEDMEIFKRALLELSPKCRRAFLLYRLEEWSDVQIAKQLGIQPRMVRHYITHAGLYCRLRIKGLSPEQAKVAAR